jgi:hypothetical protein
MFRRKGAMVRKAFGVLERLAFGPHEPSGFTGLFEAPNLNEH